MMLHFHDTLCRQSHASAIADCGYEPVFARDASYCIDAPTILPAGSTQRFDPSEDDPFFAFAAPRIAMR